MSTEVSNLEVFKAAAALGSAAIFVQKCILVATCVAFTCFVMIQIIFRYFLFLPLHGLEELAVHLAVWTYFIGAALGAHEKSHISASLLPELVKSRATKAIIEIIVTGITTVIAICMTVWAAKYLLWSIDRQPASLELRAPLYWVHAAMPVGLGLMSFYFFVGFVTDITRLVSGQLDIAPNDDGEDT